MSVNLEIMSEAIEAALAAGKMTPEEAEEAYRRLMASPDEIRQSAIDELGPEYELDTVDDMEPAFYSESETSITLGFGENKQTFQIRFLNIDDLEILSFMVPEIWQYIQKRGLLSLKKRKFMDLVNLAINFGLRDKRNGKPTVLNRKIFEVIAHCLSNPGTNRVITVGYLRGCSGVQISDAVKKVVAVNHDFFPDLSAVLPGNMIEQVSTLIGKISAIGKQASETIQTLNESLPGLGGTPNSGTTNSSTPLPVSTDSANPKSETLLLSGPGDTDKQLAGARK